MKKRIWKRYLYLFVLGLAVYIGKSRSASDSLATYDTELVQAFMLENQSLADGEETISVEAELLEAFEAENQIQGGIEDEMWAENQAAREQEASDSKTEQQEVQGSQQPQQLPHSYIEGVEEEQAQGDTSGGFVPHEKQTDYDWEALKEYKNLIATFYAIDANTSSNAQQLNLDVLLSKDMTIDKSQGPYQILVYHSHSKEAFADSRSGVREDTIVGVGERLTELLTAYGYSVLHHTEEYDTFRDDAYAVALPKIEKLLEENPSIQVVIDLHRDAGVKGVSRMIEMDGKECATFMLFNGMSYNRKTGSIKYLENPNLADNLSFSFQVQVKAGQYYPGLTRKIYLKGYRYNMHLKPKTLLIELGDSNNTVEQAMNTCEPLAHILHMVLSGE
ncbi:MAG: stage II sporulation protein P [Lachnospiraceae bacterium]|nr:stage II sporulation protein P [Lachnospiraceae bacterium]